MTGFANVAYPSYTVLEQTSLTDLKPSASVTRVIKFRTVLRLDRGNDAWKERQNQAKLMDVLQDNSSSAQERSPAQVNGESEDAFNQTYATISNISKSLKVPLGL
ncbi:UNVERIFIED_CONTAM: hypothetical protein FKN15_038545 [Acipenser sinensis]